MTMNLILSALTSSPISLVAANKAPAFSFIYVFCNYLRKNSDLCHLQHKLIDRALQSRNRDVTAVT